MTQLSKIKTFTLLSLVVFRYCFTETIFYVGNNDINEGQISFCVKNSSQDEQNWENRWKIKLKFNEEMKIKPVHLYVHI